ncbi:MAG: 3-phosphoshikimate 1-carboxyvinyltransferase [Clostridiales bacterium]|jgi:3-phosphoshikimate 1-carboxyvinyltransferase|nr:3-phosphoshikimate 1-carboxyvinyltransferase [Clostridiales bacterium]
MRVVLTPHKFIGSVRAIPSKSHLHRLLTAAALSGEKTFIEGYSDCEDVQKTAGCLSALGAVIDTAADGYEVVPRARTMSEPVLDCGESGTTLRFMLPVAAALGYNATFTGSERLFSRSSTPLLEALKSGGIDISAAPRRLGGKLRPGEYRIRGDVSSQFISGLLLALPLTGGDCVIRVEGKIESANYITMTLETLKLFGITVRTEANEYYIAGGQKYRSPGTVRAEGDWSNAAFWLTAGALNGDVTVSNLNLSSEQGDKEIMNVLERAGACVTRGKTSVNVKSAPALKAVSLDAADIPDLVPVIGILCGAASGTSIIKNVGRLRDKESDRLAAIIETLAALGVTASYEDGLKITGGAVTTAGGHNKRPFTGGRISGYNDHRMVMSAAVASLLADGEIQIDGAQAVNKSYPDFFAHLALLGGKFNVLD